MKHVPFVRISTIARCLGLSRNRVSYLVARGVLPYHASDAKWGKGTARFFSVAECMKAYEHYTSTPQVTIKKKYDASTRLTFILLGAIIVLLVLVIGVLFATQS